MKFMTITEAARALEVERYRIQRRVNDGLFPFVRVGKRELVDIDVIGPLLEAERSDGMGIAEVSAVTGLSASAIRRAIRDGWMPAEIKNGRYRIDLQAVRDAISKRMKTKIKGG
ncbi:MAG: hypothetical protein RSD95_13410 [Clostridia bacterium]